GGSSGYTYAPSTVTIPSITLPAAPSSLSATALTRGSGIRLSWSDRSNNELGFQLERRVNPTGKGAVPGPWQLVITLAPNTSDYTDTAAASLTSYTYRLRAFNLAGTSAYSNEVTVKAK
ncbi:MAG TPA: fibronectin type III domain-containing protein, partial [Verrucomicrobiae bacterium]|nr:fibronectin type III domain-containing protein [Verrucomicrobiae bacterium]